MNGQQLPHTKEAVRILDRSDFPAGVYTLRLRTEAGVAVQRVVK